MKHSESDIAAVVVAWLEALGADVYQEVELVHRGIRADIVAVVGPEVWIIETKTSASLALLGQVMERRKFAHRVYAACPVGRGMTSDICKELGIGLLSVHKGTDPRWDSDKVREVAPSRRWNSRPVKLRSKLRPEHKTAAAAGSPTGGHWSRWRDTCSRLERAVRAEPGIALKQAIEKVEHHYANRRSAYSSLMLCLNEGKVPGVRCESGKLHPVEMAA